MPAIVIRLTAKAGKATRLVQRLARHLPTEPGEPGELFWLFLRADSEGDVVDVVGLFSGGDDFPLDEHRIVGSVRTASGAGLLDGTPWVTRMQRSAAPPVDHQDPIDQ